MKNLAIFTHEIFFLQFTLALFLQIEKIEIKDFYNLCGVLAAVFNSYVYFILLQKLYWKVNGRPGSQYRSAGSNSSGGSSDGKETSPFNKKQSHLSP